jgi:hypothetical protein
MWSDRRGCSAASSPQIEGIRENYRFHAPGGQRYRFPMDDVQPSSGRTWRYRFTEPDGAELEVRDFNDDEKAETWARDLSKSNNVAIVVQRHSGFVDAWEYVTEVDERS